MDVETLGTLLLASKVNQSIKQESLFQQGASIDQKNTEFVNINKMLNEFKNNISHFGLDNGYISSAFHENTFLALCLKCLERNSINLNEIRKLKEEVADSVDNPDKMFYKKFGFNRKRSLNMQSVKEELLHGSDSTYKTEHLLYFAKYLNLSFCVVDFDSHERENFCGDTYDIRFLFKKKNGVFFLHNGSMEIHEKILHDLQQQNSLLIGSKKVMHIKKLSKLLNKIQ